MPNRSSSARLAMALVAAVAVGAACSYDWSTAGDAGSQDGGHVDGATVDGNASDAPAPDASAKDAADGAPAADAADCMRLYTQVATARSSAKVCTAMPTDCTTTVPDECGCSQIVGAQNAAWANYRAAIGAFGDAGCTNPACPQPCPTAMQHLCIVADGGGYACSQ